MQTKRYEKAKIALLNVELELKREKENAEIRVTNVEEYQVCTGPGFCTLRWVVLLLLLLFFFFFFLTITFFFFFFFG
jgi:hypothetical protein